MDIKDYTILYIATLKNYGFEYIQVNNIDEQFRNHYYNIENSNIYNSIKIDMIKNDNILKECIWELYLSGYRYISICEGKFIINMDYNIARELCNRYTLEQNMAMYDLIESNIKYESKKLILNK